jgi:hypothetical protein
LGNWYANYSLLFEAGVAIILTYVKGFNIGFLTRPLAFPHFAIPAMSYYVIIMLYDEIRKIFLRRGIVRPKGKILFPGWIARNTYY